MSVSSSVTGWGFFNRHYGDFCTGADNSAFWSFASQSAEGTCAFFVAQLRSAALAQFTVLAPQIVLAESTLSFLGLGVQEPGVSWGIVLASLRDTPVLMTHAWLAIPCVPIEVVVHLLQWVSRAMQYTDES